MIPPNPIIRNTFRYRTTDRDDVFLFIPQPLLARDRGGWLRH